ncbi:MAG: AAA family ATPase [Spirochaetales bacterium]|nr:AAA family ATPase [Spirochaetales bacterium]
MDNRIMAIVGMCGAGKSVACDVLKERGWHYIRFGQITIDKLKENGLEITPANEKEMRESLRKIYGMGAFAILSLPRIDAAVKKGNVIIDGLYSWSEYRILKEKFGAMMNVVCIHAAPEIRYERLERRQRDPADSDTRMRPLAREEARARDYAEIENIEKGGPIAMADIMIINESSEEDLKKRMEEVDDGK